MKSSLLRIVIIAGILLTKGCGFQLRGSSGFDFTSLHIKSESANQVTNAVTHLLTEEGVQIVPTQEAAQAVMYLRNEGIEQRMLTISSISGQQMEFELNFHVEMEVRKPDGTILLDNQTLTLLRDYFFDETAVLAAGAEAEMLNQEMFRDIVAQVVRRLQILKLGKIEIANTQFKGLKAKYSIGETLKLNLTEKATKKTRNYPVDIWLTLSIDDKLWFITPSKKAKLPWKITQKPQPWLRSVAATKTRHHFFDFTIPPNVGGKYTFRAVYTVPNVTLDLKKINSIKRSNIAEASVVLED